ncbi:MAG: tetratricopeptide repeat protein [Mailhella sp.]|nr:tetratricopeptide repeat protein [Mailhella sp.]
MAHEQTRKPKPISEREIDTSSVASEGTTAEQILRDMQAEVTPEAAPLLKFIDDHAPKIAAGVLSIVAIIVAVGLYNGWQEKKLENAKNELGAMSAVSDPAARLGKLESFLDSCPDGLKTAVRLEIADAASAAGEYRKALTAFKAVASGEKGGPLGYAAARNAADLEIRLGDYAAAAADCESLIASAPKDMVPELRLCMGEAAELAGDSDKARSSYQAAIDALADPAGEDAAYFRSRISNISR